VVLGVAQNYRADFADWWDVYAQADVIFVWCNGISYQDDMTAVLETAMGDAQWCKDRKLDYQFNVCAGPPVKRFPNGTVYTSEPTHAIENLKLWTHYTILSRLRRNFTDISIGGFLAMFDDYPEAEPLLVSAPDVVHLPGAKRNWWTMDAIGTPLSYDYNFRLSQKSVEMLSQNEVFGVAIPIPYMVPLPPSSLNRTILAGNTVIAQESATVMKITGLIPNNYYVGCFTDSSDRDLWAASNSSHVISQETCSEFCSNYYTPYFGLQNGTECFCGYSYGSYGPSTSCTVKCAGNPSETCGGVNANSVYRVQLDVVPLSITYEGCYGDGSARDLPVSKPSIGSVQECASNCIKYEYFGVQSGSQCFCGNKYGTYGISKGCTSPCNGNTTQTCGGSHVNSIYSYSASHNIRSL